MNGEPALLSLDVIFSDAAARDVDGKLALIGTFHSIKAKKIPFRSSNWFATAFVINLSSRIKDLPVTLNIEDANGNILASAIGRIHSIEESSPRQVVDIPFPVPPTVFKTEGDYLAVVLLDGERVGCRRFSVSLGQPAKFTG